MRSARDREPIIISLYPYILYPHILYPPLALELFGWSFNWLVLFLILSLAFGFAFKGLLGVEI